MQKKWCKDRNQARLAIYKLRFTEFDMSPIVSFSFFETRLCLCFRMFEHDTGSIEWNCVLEQRRNCSQGAFHSCLQLHVRQLDDESDHVPLVSGRHIAAGVHVEPSFDSHCVRFTLRDMWSNRRHFERCVVQRVRHLRLHRRQIAKRHHCRYVVNLLLHIYIYIFCLFDYPIVSLFCVQQ